MGSALPPVDPVQRLFELSVDMLGTASADGYLTCLNPAWERTLGWTLEELMAEPFISFVHPDDVEATINVAAKLLSPADSQIVPFENRYRTKDGDYRSIEWTGVSDQGVGYFVAKDVTDRRAAEAEHEQDQLRIRRSETLHRTLVANLPDTSVFLVDHDLRIVIADGEAIRRLPWLEDDMFRGRLVTELDAEVPDDLLQLSIENYRATLEGERRAFEFLSEGMTFAIEAVPVYANDGTVEYALVVARDITERTQVLQQAARRTRQQKAAAELGRFALQSQDLGELMTEVVNTAAATLDVDGACIMEFDEAGERLWVVAAAGPSEPLVGGPSLPLGDSANAGHTIATGAPVFVEDMRTETRFKHSAAALEFGLVSSLSVQIEGHGKLFGVLDVHGCEPRGFSEDDVAFLTAVATLIIVAVERHHEEEATRHAALHDPLTELPNRTLALDRLAHALARRKREGIDVAVLSLDLDRFKVINDSLGHAAGDEVLSALAPRLTAVVREVDTVARLGGDEFVVICPEVDGARGVTEIAKRLAAEVNRPLALSSGEHFLTVSTGITLATSRRDTPASLLRDADAAMYRAKDRGRGRFEVFDVAMRTSVMSRMRIEAELRLALDRGELSVWYQPVIDLATVVPVSTEALVRWEHPERGLIPPLEFIPIAEEAGLIAELGLQVLEQACRQTSAWQQHFDRAIGVSVNVSGRQMVNPAFPAQVASIAERSGLRAGTLALEITESVLMDEADLPTTVLSRFQEHGVALALDDFGTGYSSLSRLKRFPFDALKIDRSFVSGVGSNADDRAIVKATIDMAHAVGLTVVGEGVETREQAEFLSESGCDRAQGYLYGRPQPAAPTTDALDAFIEVAPDVSAAADPPSLVSG